MAGDPVTPLSRLLSLEARDADSGSWNVVIETAKGSRNKFKYDEALGLFRLSRVLPLGAVFPFDFGFLPSTRAEDSDPVDVLLLMDEPAFAGCLVPSRLVGVLEAEQTEGGKAVRNDRLIAVAEGSRTQRDIRSLQQLSASTLDEIEHFFASYHAQMGGQFKAVGRHGPGRAEALVEDGMLRCREGQAGGQKKGRARPAHAGS
jgi:inorganic pyrophosphatase